MRLLPFKDMLKEAQQNHYAVGAFNVVNMETVQAITSIAEQKNTPVILQLYSKHLDFAGADYISAIAGIAAKNSKTPICISLDHGKTLESIVECVDNGFTGIMIDFETSDYNRNVEIARKVVDLARKKSFSVEAELGQIFDADQPVEIRNSAMTNPGIAARFVDDTGVDALAVSIGTAHGYYSSKPQIDFGLLKKIIKTVSCPIVVHGGSDTPDEDIKEIVRMGVAKINIGTDLMVAYNKGIYEVLNQDLYSPIDLVLANGRKYVQDTVKQKIGILTAYRTN